VTSGLGASLVGPSNLEPRGSAILDAFLLSPSRGLWEAMATFGVNWEAISIFSEIFIVSVVKAQAWDCRSCAKLGGV